MKKDSDSLPTAVGRKMPAAGREQSVDYARPRQGADAGVFEPGLVDAINQVFSEFAFAYHNQYHKAFPDPESVTIGKEYWLSCLAEFSPRQITRAARKLVKNSEYLPSLSAMVKACQSGLELFGLPSPREAYLEACRAPSPKAQHNWSHVAVYHAGRASDWFVLANEPESRAYPIFEYHYQQVCERVIQGEKLDIEIPRPLTADHGRKLTPEQRQERMRRLRSDLDL